jgi:2-polyprenyl-3-methyl-5-hydroxy-6-metoxy-1,4-benzoquinol methylase
MSSYHKQEYKLYHCKGCSLQFWSPLRIIHEFYESEVFAFYEGFHTGLNAKISYNHLAFFNYLPLRKGRLLDVGCGDGVFLKEAQRIGFEVYGIDFDKKSVETAKSQFGLINTFAMSLDEFIAWFPNQRFDIITIFKVLEHQDNPKDFIEKLRKLLKPGGYIAGSVPNRERVFADKDRSALGG